MTQLSLFKEVFNRGYLLLTRHQTLELFFVDLVHSRLIDLKAVKEAFNSLFEC